MVHAACALYPLVSHDLPPFVLIPLNKEVGGVDALDIPFDGGSVAFCADFFGSRSLKPV